MSRKQAVADLSCDDSTSVGTPVPKGAARRDPRRGAIPVTRSQARFPFLPLPGEVVSGIQAAKSLIKFQKGAALLYLCECGRAALRIGEAYECQCKLLRCDHPAAPAGGGGALHKKGSQQDRRPDREKDRCGADSFYMKISN